MTNRSHDGQGIIGVMVSGGLLLVMVAGILAVLDNTMKTQRGTAQSTEFAAMTAEISFLLTDTTQCTAALGPSGATTGIFVTSSAGTCPSVNYSVTSGGGSYRAIKTNLSGAQVNLIQQGKRYKGLFINSICVQKIDDQWSLGTNRYPVNVIIQAQKTEGSSGAQKFTATFYTVVNLDPSGSGKVLSCGDYVTPDWSTPTPTPTATPTPSPTPTPTPTASPTPSPTPPASCLGCTVTFTDAGHTTVGGAYSCPIPAGGQGTCAVGCGTVFSSALFTLSPGETGYSDAGCTIPVNPTQDTTNGFGGSSGTVPGTIGAGSVYFQGCTISNLSSCAYVGGCGGPLGTSCMANCYAPGVWGAYVQLPPANYTQTQWNSLICIYSQ